MSAQVEQVLAAAGQLAQLADALEVEVQRFDLGAPDPGDTREPAEHRMAEL